MLVDASSQASAANVTGAIQKAAQLTGASFRYLLATAKVESNLNPHAAAKTSSAGGLFQFIDQTWLGTLKEAGPALGYARHASAISRDAGGRYVVSDPRMHAEIMQLRQDPTANAMMAGAFTRSNADYLSTKLGRMPTDGELYIAHFLGASGAAKLIGQAEQSPSVRAANDFPGAARANRSIFFDKGGRARNAAEVHAVLSGRLETALRKQEVPGQTQTPQVAFAPAAPDSANLRVARAYAALAPAAHPAGTRSAAEPTYHNPYRASERRTAVAPAVNDLWAQAAANVARVRALQTGADVPATRMAAAQAPQSAPSPARPERVAAAAPNTEPLGLFQDHRPNVRALFGS